MDPSNRPTLAPEQAAQILPLLDEALTNGMQQLRSAIDAAFYNEEARYTAGMRAAYDILQAALKPVAAATREMAQVRVSPPDEQAS